MHVLTSQALVEEHKIIILLFGVGLIGSAIETAVCNRIMVTRTTIDYDWYDHSNQIRQLEKIFSVLRKAMITFDRTKIHVVWCAGKAGFNANEKDTLHELNTYHRVLDFAERIAISINRNVTFHMMSSGGGLFEGQRFVADQSMPAPKRPYGILKMKQEQILKEMPDNFTKRVYRPSSVYANIQNNKRQGLISTLIVNGMRHKVSHITGRMTTLRDFIFADDLGNFCADCIMNVDQDEVFKTITLASGKPSTIHEIKKIVEEVINRKIYVNYMMAMPNEADISYSPRILPSGLVVTDMAHSIKQIFKRALNKGLL